MKIIKKAAIIGSIAILPSISIAQTLEWTSGQLGGGWYSMASGIANLLQKDNPELNLKIVPGGGTANPSKVNKGRSQLGFGLDTFTYQASTGTSLYEGKPHPEIRMIGMSFSDIYTHFIRAKDAKYSSIEEILKTGKDVQIGITKAGSSDEQAFRWLMKTYNTSYKDLRDNRGFKINHGSYSELSSQFKDGQIDYAFMNLGVPGAAIIDMSQARPLNLINFPDELLKKLRADFGFLSGDIKAGTYKGADENATTIKMATTLMAAKSVSEDTIYKITKSLCENQDKLASIHSSMAVFDCATAAKDSPAPVHPGAAKYYKEKNYL